MSLIICNKLEFMKIYKPVSARIFLVKEISAWYTYSVVPAITDLELVSMFHYLRISQDSKTKVSFDDLSSLKRNTYLA